MGVGRVDGGTPSSVGLKDVVRANQAKRTGLRCALAPVAHEMRISRLGRLER